MCSLSTDVEGQLVVVMFTLLDLVVAQDYQSAPIASFSQIAHTLCLALYPNDPLSEPS
jgi:hypothetical protein